MVGQNARTLVRFPVPIDAPDCELESATLRLFADGMTEDRTLEARPLAGPFRESTLTWTQPAGRAERAGGDDRLRARATASGTSRPTSRR